MLRRRTIMVLVIPLAGCVTLDPIEQEPFDRPMIYSVNPVGNGEIVGAPETTGSPFVRYDNLVFEKVSEAGSRSARVLASWREIEAAPGRWDFSSLDREIELCEKFGIEPVVLIVNIPAWVSPTGEPTPFYPPKEENAADFDVFITRLARRYLGRARYYEFWNEQNGWGWHVDRKDGKLLYNRVDEYIPWLYRCYRAMKRVDPDLQVALGGLDDAEGHAPIFVEMAYQMRREHYDDEKFWDAIADHPYNKKAYETAERPIAKLDAIRAIAARYGDADIPLWITEYGWTPEETSVDAQTRGTRDFLLRFAQPDQADLVIAQQLALADFQPVHVGIGLCNLNLRPRPAFHAFQALARPREPQVSRFDYRLAPDGAVLIRVDLPRPLPADTRAHLDVIDERGRTRGRVSWGRGDRFAHRFDDLPPDEPLLARLRYTLGGRRRYPIARLPIIRPAPGEIVPNGGYESLFRAGVPWGWSLVGDVICLDTRSAGPRAVRNGRHGLALTLFDNHEPYRFDDGLRIPVAAARSDRLVARCFARYEPALEQKPSIAARLRLIDPDQPPPPAPTRTVIGEVWTEISARLIAPCDSPLLEIRFDSRTLPKDPQKVRKVRWRLFLDDLSVTPEAR